VDYEQKNEQVHQTLLYVLVEVGEEFEMPNFYIYHSSEIEPSLKNDHSYGRGFLRKMVNQEKIQIC
tara:strand:+ start:471 stop:668 length:198 start_codon:yes stop_codon:yes gene_type:complete